MKDGGVAGGRGDDGITEECGTCSEELILHTKALGRPRSPPRRRPGQFCSGLHVSMPLELQEEHKHGYFQVTTLEIIGARNPGLLQEYGGHIEIMKAWAKSTESHGVRVKKGIECWKKITVSPFKEIQ